MRLGCVDDETERDFQTLRRTVHYSDGIAPVELCVRLVALRLIYSLYSDILCVMK